MATKLTWTQEGVLNVFTSGKYRVEETEDDVWTATFDGEELGTAPSKTKAANLARKHADAVPTTTVLTLTASEKAILDLLPAAYGDLVASQAEGLTPANIVSKLQSLGRRKLVELGEQVTATKLGVDSAAAWKPADPRFRKDGTPRKSGSETRYGARPEWAGERVTEVEWLEGRLANAEASLAFAFLRLRMHPYSKRVVKRHKSAQGRVEAITADLAEARARAAAALASGHAAPLATDDETDAAE